MKLLVFRDQLGDLVIHDLEAVDLGKQPNLLLCGVHLKESREFGEEVRDILLCVESGLETFAQKLEFDVFGSEFGRRAALATPAVVAHVVNLVPDAGRTVRTRPV